MRLSLEQCQTDLLTDRSWSSSGPSFKNRVRRQINRAVKQLAARCPTALSPDVHHVYMRAGVKGSTATVGARVKATTDTKVLEFRTAADGTLSTGTGWVPTVDRTWDGVMHLEITRANGRKTRRQVREWWSDGATPARYYASLDRPWPATGTAVFDFEAYQPAFYLPADTIEVMSPIRTFGASETQIEHISSSMARRDGLEHFARRVTGTPERFWRGKRHEMLTPTAAPTVGVNAAVAADNVPTYPAWLGPVQAGKYRFCYTYVHGKTEEEWGDSPSGVRDPIWESAPSPVSEVFDHAASTGVVSHEDKAIYIQFDNPDEILDFAGDALGIRPSASYPTGTEPLRFGRSGLRIRVYVARDDIYTAHGGTATAGGNVPALNRHNRDAVDGRFMLLAEIDPMDVEPDMAALGQYRICAFNWDGTIPVPDRERALTDSHGYYEYRVYPVPSSTLEFDVEVMRQPVDLVHPNDPLPLREEAYEAFMELALSLVCRMDGVDKASENDHLEKFEQKLGLFKKGLGDNVGVTTNVYWMSRARTSQFITATEG
jgi:hypothetical protein